MLAEPISDARLFGRELLAPRAAVFDHIEQQIMGQLDALVVQPFFDVQQPAAHQHVDRFGRNTALDQFLAGPVSTLIDSRKPDSLSNSSSINWRTASG